MSNARAEAWLRGIGFGYEEEPAWVLKGLKPDFFCNGPLDLWVEVKTFGPEERFERLADAHVGLRERLNGINANAQAMAWVRPPLEAGDAKLLAALVRREAARPDFGVTYKRVLVLIPAQPVYGSFIRFTFDTDEGDSVVVSAVMSQTGKYGWPAVLTPKNYQQEIELALPNGVVEKRILHEITTFDDHERAAMELSQGDGRFNFLGTAPIGTAAKVNTAGRIRNAVSEANAQNKNGCQYRDVPTLTVIYHDDVLAAEDEMVLAALYGDLAYTAPVNDFQNGRLVLTQNGVFGPEKNTTTSAVCYIRNGTQPLIVHNRWAKKPLPTELLPGRHAIPYDDGHFEVKEIKPVK